MREIGWLIESGAPGMTNPPHYLRVWVNGGRASTTWTPHAEIAMRFAREEDARHFWYLHGETANIPRIAEHLWVDGDER